MTKIKFCGLTRDCDIVWANQLTPDYIGFVFAPGSKRFVTAEKAAALKALLSPRIQAVGVFVNEELRHVAALLNGGIIDMAQLHGNEDEDYIRAMQALTQKPLIQAFIIQTADDIKAANESLADLILLDSGAGTGKSFNWDLISKIRRPYFLAGGLSPENVSEAIARLQPFAVDVSSGIETDGIKDKAKMAAFAAAALEVTKK